MRWGIAAYDHAGNHIFTMDRAYLTRFGATRALVRERPWQSMFFRYRVIRLRGDPLLTSTPPLPPPRSRQPTAPNPGVTERQPRRKF